VRVLLERNDGNMSLVLALQSSADQSEAELRFNRITQLRFRGDTTDLSGLVLLQCEDVASRGWEGVRFMVKDYEEEFISFYCDDIEAL
jgi:hypothetical protein